MFSKTCKHAIKATIYVASRSLENERISLNLISEGINSPKAFTAKILQILVKANILTSSRGPKGGFYIDEGKMKTVCLGDIVNEIDGNSLLVNCGLGLKKCSSEKPCPIHDQWQIMKEEIRNTLYSSTLYDMAQGQKEGLFVLI